MQPLNFKSAVENCLEHQKIVFGTRSEKFHIIDCNDRDFYTGYASTKNEALSLGEEGVKSRSIKPHVFYERKNISPCKGDV